MFFKIQRIATVTKLKVTSCIGVPVLSAKSKTFLIREIEKSKQIILVFQSSKPFDVNLSYE